LHWVGREELFERERGGDPDFQVWDGCALASESASVLEDLDPEGLIVVEQAEL
jgi:hypothetical protein